MVNLSDALPTLHQPPYSLGRKYFTHCSIVVINPLVGSADQGDWLGW
ncbi:hypothetical protein [Moorena sp. SIOASIH]|nr:hypothetical protein [Moorena sp. SIOASIH]